MPDTLSAHLTKLKLWFELKLKLMLCFGLMSLFCLFVGAACYCYLLAGTRGRKVESNTVRDDQDLSKKADDYGRKVSPYFNIENKEEKYQADKLFKRLRRKVGHAIGDYGMIEANDKIMVCISGGKDSYAMLDFLLSIKRSAPIPFTLVPVHIDPGFPGTPEGVVKRHLDRVGLDYLILKRPVYEISKAKVGPDQRLCSICSRMRRGFLYSTAREIGANKLALGHHRDDILATFFLNLFYSGIMKTMPPILRTDTDDLTVIRPLAYCRERDLTTLAKLKQYELLPKGLCGYGENEERAAMLRMIKQWEKENPKRPDIIFKALKNVVPSHLLDRNLFDFTKISDGPRVK